jgi:hypothetical protein
MYEDDIPAVIQSDIGIACKNSFDIAKQEC